MRIGDRLALGLVGRAVPLDVDADAGDTGVVPVTLEHQVNELLDRGVSRLDLEPDAEADAVEEGERLLIAVLLGDLDEWMLGLCREAELDPLACQPADDPDGFGNGAGEALGHPLSHVTPVPGPRIPLRAVGGVAEAGPQGAGVGFSGSWGRLGMTDG